MEQNHRGTVRQANRNHIITTAGNLFAEKGYHGVKTKEIAVVSGISEVTLFNHFSSKDDLYKAVIDDVTAQKFQSTDEIFASLPLNDLASDLNIIGEYLVQDFMQSRKIIGITLKEKLDAIPHKHIIRRQDNFIRNMADVLENYRDSLIDSPENLAAIFIRSILGQLIHAVQIEDCNETEFRKLTRRFITIFIRGIQK